MLGKNHQEPTRALSVADAANASQINGVIPYDAVLSTACSCLRTNIKKLISSTYPSPNKSTSNAASYAMQYPLTPRIKPCMYNIGDIHRSTFFHCVTFPT